MAIENNILSIDSDDEEIDVKSLAVFLEDDMIRNKNKVAREFSSIGEELLAEIEEKKALQEIEKQNLIIFIVKHSKKTFSSRVINSYSIEDVRKIYEETKVQRTEEFIKYVLKQPKTKYNINSFRNLSFDEIKVIYDRVYADVQRKANESFFIKAFHFMFNLSH
jgi:predicted polyphosphate/ATP-dependent NAD kinase